MTPYLEIIEMFLGKIKNNRDYFASYDVEEEELESLITERSIELLRNASSEFQQQISLNQNVNFYDSDDFMEQFNFEVTNTEKDIISDYMYIKLLDEERVKLSAMQKYLGTDINVFSPAKERDSFINMIRYERELVSRKVRAYNMRNRLTNEFLLPY